MLSRATEAQVGHKMRQIYIQYMYIYKPTQNGLVNPRGLLIDNSCVAAYARFISVQRSDGVSLCSLPFKFIPIKANKITLLVNFVRSGVDDQTHLHTGLNISESACDAN